MRSHANWTIQRMALEIRRVAHEGLGHTLFEQILARFNREIARGSDDHEIQLCAVTRMLVKLTDSRTGPKNSVEVRLAGLCFIWLARTRVQSWTVGEMYRWALLRIRQEQ